MWEQRRMACRVSRPGLLSPRVLVIVSDTSDAFSILQLGRDDSFVSMCTASSQSPSEEKDQLEQLGGGFECRLLLHLIFPIRRNYLPFTCLTTLHFCDDFSVELAPNKAFALLWGLNPQSVHRHFLGAPFRQKINL